MSTSRVVVPYAAQRPAAWPPAKVNRRITAHGLHGLGAASLSPPTGAGAGAGAEIGASQGASIGSAIVPGIGTAIGAVIGAIGGAIAGALGKADPENANFDQAVAIYNQNPSAIYSLENPYLALAGLFDLNIQTNIPIYRKFGHMGEAAFVVWLCNTVYQAAQAGKITANDTALTVMSKVVQPAIDAWGYGAMSDPHAGLINALIVAMILQYTEGAQHNWLAEGGDYPTQFNSIPPFALPTAVAQSSAPAATGAPSVTSTPSGTSLVAGSPGSISTPNGTLTLTAAGVWQLGTGPTIVGYSSQFTNMYVSNGTLFATNVNGGLEYWPPPGSTSSAWWIPVTAAGTSSAANAAAASAPLPPVPPPVKSVTVQSTAPVPPATPTTLESADGSEVTAPGTALETPAGTMVYLGNQTAGDPNNYAGYPVWESGVQNGYAVGLIMGNGGTVYAVNAQGTWFQWGANNWTQLPAAPNLNGPTSTTSTTASPQSGVSCTAGAAAKTTGGVIGTTSSGEAVTDTDIQDLISQMTAQGATAAQTYSAIMAALQSEGVANTAGVQSQVAAQVQASVPSAPVAATSNTGLYLVGGGLAVLGLLYFMGHRKSA